MSVPHEHRTRRRVFGFSILAVLFGVLSALWGCATPLLVAGATSAAFTGKALHDHAISAASDKDCRTIQGVARKDRKLCEDRGSPATEKDFKGILGFFEGRKEAKVYEGPVANEAPSADQVEATATSAQRAPAIAQSPARSRPMQVASAQTGVTTDFYDLGEPYAVFDKSGFVGVRIIPHPVRKPL